MDRKLSRRSSELGTFLFLLLVSAPWAYAQTNDELYANLQLGFTTPGGRSLAMGQAFIGEANDASAAYSNPAGLLALTALEASFQLGLADTETSVADGSSLAGSPTNQGIDVGRPSKSFNATTSGLTFLSVVYPADRFTVAFYRHELANTRSTIDGSQGAFFREGQTRSRTGALASDLELNIVNLGFSGAYRLSDRVWLGAGLSIYSLDLQALGERFKTTDVTPVGNAVTSFDSVDLDPTTQTERRIENGSDTDIGFNVGILSRNASNTISFGAVYRRGPKFDYPSQYRLGPRAIADGASPSVESDLSGTATFHAPDFLGVGVSLHPTPAWTINVDFARVLYSNLEPDANFDATVAAGQASLDDFQVKDGSEFHLGGEYVWNVTSSAKVAFRGGTWYDPDHQLTFVGTVDTLQARFPAGEDNWHMTGGIGILVESFDLSFGVDTSNVWTRATFASAIRF